MPSRPYRQIRRAEAAEETRRRIVSAARDQLLGTAEPFTIESVARRAGVARVTVYAQFGSRDQLREAVFDQLAESGGLGRISEAMGQADPMEGLHRLVEVFHGFYATHRAAIRRLRALGVLAPEDGGRHEDRNARRRHMIGVLLNRALDGSAEADRRGDREVTASLIQALTSFEFFDQLAGELEGPSAVTKHAWALVQASLPRRLQRTT